MTTRSLVPIKAILAVCLTATLATRSLTAAPGDLDLSFNPGAASIAIGRDDPSLADNEHLSRVLWEKGIWHALRLWDGWAHDWPWWREMIRRYIGGHD